MLVVEFGSVAVVDVVPSHLQTLSDELPDSGMWRCVVFARGVAVEPNRICLAPRVCKL